MLRTLIIIYLILCNLLTGPTDHRVTVYGPECGNVTATGHVIDWKAVAEGREFTAAVSPVAERLYPLNSVIYVSGRGFYTVRDRTARWLDSIYPEGTVDLASHEHFCEQQGVWLIWKPEDGR